MRHRLVAPGCEWLVPFAETRIKVLLGLGTPYADQSFEVNGYTVRVQVTPGHEYIRIDGGSVTLKMDSGVVDIINTGEIESPAGYLPRNLIEAGQAVTYNAGFADSSSTPHQWRMKDAASGQISGDVTFSGGKKFSGKVPVNATTAASFAPKTAKDANEQLIYADDDGNVPIKKQMVTKCPASIFTGKCRMYVQAMYGRHTHLRETDGAGGLLSEGAPIPLQVALRASSLGTPSLDLSAYLDKDDIDDNVTYQPVHLHCGCGVYLDPVKGTHWLIQTSTSAVAVYPLIGSAAAQSLRKKLVDGTLSADDAEHLEAYILSTCQPYVKKAQVLSIPETPSYSMGYGWHWNWSGTTADIAYNIQEYIGFEGGYDRWGMVSTHYRLNMGHAVAEDKTVTWSVTREIVSGPDHWAMMPIIWSIYEPMWTPIGPMLESTLNFYSAYREGNATYYVYYLRDALQKCTVSLVNQSGASRRELSTPTFASSTVPFGPMEGQTCGLLNGWGRDYYTTPSYFLGSFTCGSESVSGMYNSHTEKYTELRVDGKSAGSIEEVFTTYTGSYTGEIAPYYGYPTNMNNPGAPVWANSGGLGTYSPNPGGADSQDYTNPDVTYTKVITRKETVKTSLMTVIIPAYDSEAVFFHHQKTDSVTNNTINWGHVTSPNHCDTRGVRYKNGDLSWDGTWTQGPRFTRYLWSTANLYAAPNSSNVLPPDETALTMVLIGHGGVVPATLSDLAYYHWTDITGPVSAWSGVRVDAPVSYSPGHIDPVGTTVDNSLAALVGWV